jgi:hypothetical protein
MTQLVVSGEEGGVGWGGATGSSQCWSVGQPVHSSPLPTMVSVASDEDVFAQFKQQSRKNISPPAGLQLFTRPKPWAVLTSASRRWRWRLLLQRRAGSFGFCDGGGCGNVRGSRNTCFGPFYCPEFSGHSTKDWVSPVFSVPGLQASNVTVKVCVITNNHGTVNF